MLQSSSPKKLSLSIPLIIISLLLIFLPNNSNAALRTTIQNGAWSDPFVWDCGCVPLPTDDAIVNDTINEFGDIIINDLTINMIGRLLDAGNNILSITGNLIILGDFYYATTEFIDVGPDTITNTSGPMFNNVVINKIGGDIILNTNITVFDTLFLLNGDIVLGANDISLGSNNNSGTISGGSSSSYIQADGTGVVKKIYTVLSPMNSIVNFQVGDIAVFSPLTLMVNFATFVGRDAFISINVTDAIHPTLIDPDYITRYWTINSSGVTSIDYMVDYIYDDSDIVGNENSFQTERWSGSSWFAYDPVDAANNLFTVRGGISDIPALDDFTGGGNGGVMAIEVLHFTVQPKGEVVEINWATTMEVNNDFFTIERSTDGQNYEELATLQGVDSSMVTNRYEFVDQEPHSGISYYRLKQTDIDGQYAYFTPVAIKFSSDNLLFIKVYPNPAIDNQPFNVELNGFEQNEEVVVVLLNQMGEKVFSKVVVSKGDNLLTAIDPAFKLPCGIYFVVGSSNNEIYKQKLVITSPNQQARTFASY